MSEPAIRIEVAANAVVVEGRLLDDTCEEFERALETLRSSRAVWTTVDLSQVTDATPRPIAALFTVWLDLFRQGRAPFLKAPDEVWRMLGRAAVGRGFSRKPATSLRVGRTGWRRAGAAGRGFSGPALRPRLGTDRSQTR